MAEGVRLESGCAVKSTEGSNPSLSAPMGAERNASEDLIALFDLDSTLADFHKSLRDHLEAMRSPSEPMFDWEKDWDEERWPDWLKARVRIIKSKVGFWRNLPRLEAGFDILNIANKYEFNCQILSRGPKWHPPAFAEKAEWCAQYVPDLHINLVRNKSQYYGKILVDDWPGYFMEWLKVRPRGWVIAVDAPWNRHVEHPRLIKYNGKNLKEVDEVFFRVRRVTLGQ